MNSLRFWGKFNFRTNELLGKFKSNKKIAKTKINFYLSIFFVNIKLFPFGQLLEAGPDGRRVALLGHLYGVLQRSDEGHGQLGHVVDVGEDGVNVGGGGD